MIRSVWASSNAWIYGLTFGDVEPETSIQPPRKAACIDHQQLTNKSKRSQRSFECTIRTHSEFGIHIRTVTVLRDARQVFEGEELIESGLST